MIERSRGSTTDAEALDEGLVALAVGILQIVQKATALVDHLQQPATRVMILLVIGEVLRKMLDARGQQGNLHFGRTGVARRATIVRDDLVGLFGSKRHDFDLCDVAYGAVRPRQAHWLRSAIRVNGTARAGGIQPLIVTGFARKRLFLPRSSPRRRGIFASKP